MRVHLTPPHGLSKAMTRVARALSAHAPRGVEVVDDRQSADLVVFHVINYNGVPEIISSLGSKQRYAMLQYCYKSAGADLATWLPVWQGAACVLSYYDIAKDLTEAGLGSAPLYLTPLGVDAAFTEDVLTGDRPYGVMTSGYVAGDGAEAIEEPVEAAIRNGYPTIHLGPRPVGMSLTPSRMKMVHNIGDFTLASLYRQCLWVSGLRHVEGFELPALEGLMCGARPVMFDRPEMRLWYEGHAVFIPECSGARLTDSLTALFSVAPAAVTADERQAVREKFDWSRIATGFWERVL